MVGSAPPPRPSGRLQPSSHAGGVSNHAWAMGVAGFGERRPVTFRIPWPLHLNLSPYDPLVGPAGTRLPPRVERPHDVASHSSPQRTCETAASFLRDRDRYIAAHHIELEVVRPYLTLPSERQPIRDLRR